MTTVPLRYIFVYHSIFDSVFTNNNNNKSSIYQQYADWRNHDWRSMLKILFLRTNMCFSSSCSGLSDPSIPSLYRTVSRDSWPSDRRVPLSSEHTYTSLCNSGVACSSVSTRRYYIVIRPSQTHENRRICCTAIMRCERGNRSFRPRLADRRYIIARHRRWFLIRLYNYYYRGRIQN